MGNQQLVYIVDDDIQVRESLRALVEATGFETRCFDSGVNFLSQYEPENAGCVIVDFRMTGMTGLELQEHRRESDSSLPVIMMSGHYRDREREIAMKQGAIGLLSKPFSSLDLIALIEKAIDSIRE